MKKNILITGGSLVSLCLLAVAWLWARPPIPVSWKSLSPGMPRAEVLATQPGMFTDMYEVKGIDTLTIPNSLPWYPNGYWQLSLTYTSEGSVKGVYYRYINRDFGWFNVTTGKW